MNIIILYVRLNGADVCIFHFPTPLEWMGGFGAINSCIVTVWLQYASYSVDLKMLALLILVHLENHGWWMYNLGIQWFSHWLMRVNNSHFALFVFCVQSYYEIVIKERISLVHMHYLAVTVRFFLRIFGSFWWVYLFPSTPGTYFHYSFYVFINVIPVDIAADNLFHLWNAIVRFMQILKN